MLYLLCIPRAFLNLNFQPNLPKFTFISISDIKMEIKTIEAFILIKPLESKQSMEKKK